MAVKLDPPKVRIQTEHLELSTNDLNYVNAKEPLSFRVNYLGKALVDRRYTVLIIQWVVREISQAPRSGRRKVNFLLASDGLHVENADGGENPASTLYKFDSILKLPRLKNQDKLLAFVILGKTEAAQCCCHAFECEDQETVWYHVAFLMFHFAVLSSYF